jgi:hypothetical protein
MKKKSNVSVNIPMKKKSNISVTNSSIRKKSNMSVVNSPIRKRSNMSVVNSPIRKRSNISVESQPIEELKINKIIKNSTKDNITDSFKTNKISKKSDQPHRPIQEYEEPNVTINGLSFDINKLSNLEDTPSKKSNLNFPKFVPRSNKINNIEQKKSIDLLKEKYQNDKDIVINNMMSDLHEWSTVYPGIEVPCDMDYEKLRLIHDRAKKHKNIHQMSLKTEKTKKKYHIIIGIIFAGLAWAFKSVFGTDTTNFLMTQINLLWTYDTTLEKMSLMESDEPSAIEKLPPYAQIGIWVLINTVIFFLIKRLTGNDDKAAKVQKLIHKVKTNLNSDESDDSGFGILGDFMGSFLGGNDEEEDDNRRSRRRRRRRDK